MNIQISYRKYIRVSAKDILNRKIAINIKEYKDEIKNWMKDVESENFHKFKEIRKSSPKKGTVCVFNGMIPHHGSYPSKEDRYVINMNITTKNTLTLL